MAAAAAAVWNARQQSVRVSDRHTRWMRQDLLHVAWDGEVGEQSPATSESLMFDWTAPLYYGSHGTCHASMYGFSRVIMSFHIENWYYSFSCSQTFPSRLIFQGVCFALQLPAFSEGGVPWSRRRKVGGRKSGHGGPSRGVDGQDLSLFVLRGRGRDGRRGRRVWRAIGPEYRLRGPSDADGSRRWWVLFGWVLQEQEEDDGEEGIWGGCRV